MNELDSRAIKLGDHFLQRFSIEGTVEYTINPIAGKTRPATSNAYEIKVKKRQSPAPKHFNLVVSVNAGTFAVDSPSLEIEVDDVVVWRTNDARLSGFVVTGQDGPIYLSSASLKDNCVYTHAFGLPGVYNWADPIHGKVAGRVNVTNPRDKYISQPDWNHALSQGTAIKINGSTVDPKEVSILPCQSVFWIIEAADGIGIAGERKA